MVDHEEGPAVNRADERHSRSKGERAAGPASDSATWTESAWVALGSNLGDRPGLLCAARDLLEAESGIHVSAASGIWETAPVGPGDQAPYLNAAIRLETPHAPRVLLDTLLDVERRLGRDRSRESVRFGPRPIDLDLLLFADQCIDEPGLEVPHPRLHERAFVLLPLAEIAANVVHPRLGGRIETWAAPWRGKTGAARFAGGSGTSAWRVFGDERSAF